MVSFDKFFSYKKFYGYILNTHSDNETEMLSFVDAVDFLDKMEIIHIGEQMRQGLHCSDLVKDRKYHFRSYKSCVTGKEMVDWLVKNKHCDTRKQALEGLSVLQKCSLFHHVCDDHQIKDENLFYRFRKDDGTFKEDRDLVLFYKAQELHNGLSARTTGIIRSYQQDGELFRNAFQGSDFVQYLVREGEAYGRDEAVAIGRKLLENDTIRHVTDDYHFRDDSHLLYQFTLDFTRRRYLSEIFNYNHIGREEDSAPSPCLWQFPKDNKSDHREPVEFHTPKSTPRNTPDATRRRLRPADNSPDSPPDSSLESRHSDDSGNSTDTSETVVDVKSVLIRHASVQELESPDTPYIKQYITIQSDPVGFGFVIRGECPTYVQAVDPTGPAAVAGLKVRQYIHSVNGKYMLRGDHQTVGKEIMQSNSHVNVTVMTHKRAARHLDDI